MLATFQLVGQQVVVLFLLMLVGAICNKAGFFGEPEVKGLSKMVLYFVTPCVIVESFQREPNGTMIRNLLITTGIAFASYILGIVLANLCIHDKDKSKELVLRFGAVFGNCGFMSLPIEEALLGEDGVFYGAVFIAAFNLIVWTYGLAVMSGDKKNISLKKLAVNPGILGTIAGLIVLLFRISLPTVFQEPISFMADLNTPLPMIIIGYYLGNLKLHHLVENKKQYLSMLLKLVCIPGLTLLMMWPMHLEKTIIMVCVIASAAPTAANTAMFAALFNRDSQLAAQMVSVGTLFSLITIPSMVALATLL